MTIAIVDDFEPDQRSIADYTERFLKEKDVPPPQFFFYFSGEAFVSALSSHFFDFVLLDCRMDGMDGLETAKELRRKDKDAALIFITSCEDYAVDGYLVDACGYLVKPYTYDDFSRVFEAAFHRFPRRWEMIVLFDGSSKRWIPTEDIVYCDIHGHYSQIHFRSRQILRVRMTFSDLAALVAPYPQFLECYRGCIINMARVKRTEEMNFLMDTGERVPFRKKEQRAILQKYSNYLFDTIRSETI